VKHDVAELTLPEQSTSPVQSQVGAGLQYPKGSVVTQGPFFWLVMGSVPFQQNAYVSTTSSLSPKMARSAIGAKTVLISGPWVQISSV